MGPVRTFGFDSTGEIGPVRSTVAKLTRFGERSVNEMPPEG
jgi:hypothetical protein